MSTKTYEQKVARLVQEAMREVGQDVPYTACLSKAVKHCAEVADRMPKEARALLIINQMKVASS